MKKEFPFRVRTLIDSAFHMCWKERGFRKIIENHEEGRA